MLLQENSMMLPAISSSYGELSAQEPSMGLQKDQLVPGKESEPTWKQEYEFIHSYYDQ